MNSEQGITSGSILMCSSHKSSGKIHCWGANLEFTVLDNLPPSKALAITEPVHSIEEQLCTISKDNGEILCCTLSTLDGKLRCRILTK